MRTRRLRIVVGVDAGRHRASYFPRRPVLADLGCAFPFTFGAVFREKSGMFRPSPFFPFDGLT
jgi:hypothetical protein